MWKKRESILSVAAKTKKIKHKEIAIRFKSPEEAKHHIEFTQNGILVYADDEKTKIVSSEIITTLQEVQDTKNSQ
jgi:hypothetical protein